jgi:2,4-dienoyl-CoA reductase-like NADH-dependent reductase (Old Yellow Enzyme family)
LSTDLFAPLTFARGPAMKNRLALAPLTNQQSHADGTLSDEEFAWLTYRAEGGFGLTMTCAAHVQPSGQGFAGQLAIFGDQHVPGLSRLAAAIKDHDSVAALQLYHAGPRSSAELIGEPTRGPSDDPATGARGLSLAEVEQLRDDFVAGAVRAEKAGFDGVELHGAHGYIITQFLSSESNHRQDRYGGSFENRRRLLDEVIAGIRASTRSDFQLGVRMSPERWGLKLAETRAMAGELMAGGQLDYLDLSLWDYAKAPEDAEFQSRSLMGWFADLPRGGTRLGCAGKVMSAADARACLANGMDFVLLGRAAILHHDWPLQAAADPDFTSVATPVTLDYLRGERLSAPFLAYVSSFKGFVAESEAA